MLMIWLAARAQPPRLARHRRNAIVSPITGLAASMGRGFVAGNARRRASRRAAARFGAPVTQFRGDKPQTPAACGLVRAAARSASSRLAFRRGAVRKGGLEPPRGYPLEPKSSASTNSATFAGPGDCTAPRRALGHYDPGTRRSAPGRLSSDRKEKRPAGPGVFGIGGPSRIRTLDLLIKSQLHYSDGSTT